MLAWRCMAPGQVWHAARGLTRLVAGRVPGLIAVASLLSCGGGTPEPGPPSPGPLASLSVSVLLDTLQLGQATRATAEGRTAAGAAVPAGDVAWSTASAAVATVTITGVVTARGIGTTQVIAAAGGKQGTASIRVLPVPVAAVAVTPGSLFLAPGVAKQLVAVAVDAAGRPLNNRSIAWLSSDTVRVQVSDSGLVTAVSPGITSVSAISEGAYTSIDVRVSGPPGPVATVTVTPAAASLSLGQSLQLKASLEDIVGNLATDRLVTWSSRDTTRVGVTAAGLVQANAVGTTVVDAISEGKRGSVSITVVDPLDAITVGVADPLLGDIAGDTLTVIAFIKARNPIVRVDAKFADVVGDLVFGPINSRVSGWKADLDLSSLHFGAYQLIVTATDALGNRGIGTVAIKRGAREGKGGTTIPPRPR